MAAPIPLDPAVTADSRGLLARAREAWRASRTPYSPAPDTGTATNNAIRNSRNTAMSIYRRTLIRAFLGLLLITGASTATRAQTGSIPSTIAYTGFLRDSAGDPVVNPVNLTFELFDAATGGTALWSETHNGVAVAAGVFSAQLGSVASFESQGLAFDRPLFLAISVNGEVLNTRLPMTSAPYALRSGEGISNVFVSCPAESIQAAIDRAPAGGALIVTIEGICEENVNLERDRVTFLSATDTAPDVKGGVVPTDGIRGNVDSSAALRLDGASDIVVRGLVLESAPGANRRGIWVFDNGSVALLNVLLRNGFVGGFANNGGFIQAIDSKAEGSSNYGFEFTDNGHGWIQDSIVLINATVTSASDEGAIGAYRSGNVRFRGANLIVNAGNDGQYNDSDPDAAVNDDNGPSLNVFHGVQIRQDGGHSRFVGEVTAGNQVQVSLRDPELLGDISLSNNSQMELRTSSAGGQELGARRIDVSNSSYLNFGRDNIEITVTGPVNVSNHSRVGIFRDTITSTFGPVNVNNYSEFHVRGTSTIAGDVNVNNNSDFNSWQQQNVVALSGLFLHHQSRANLRGAISIAGDLRAYRHSSVDLYDGDNQSTTGKTLVDVGGRVEVNDGSNLSINNTAVMSVAGGANFYNRGELSLNGSFRSPEGCSNDCSVANASAFNVVGAQGIQLGQYASLSIGEGAVVRGESMGVGPFATLNLYGGSGLEVEAGGNAGPIRMFNFNQVFINGGSRIHGDVEVGSFSNVNVDGPGNRLDGSLAVNPGTAPGIVSVSGELEVVGGDIDCRGQDLNTGTVNVGGGTVTFSGGGGFVNCATP